MVRVSEPRRVDLMLVGYGTVGSAVHRAIEDQHDVLEERHGLDLRVASIARSGRVAHDADGIPFPDGASIGWQTGDTVDAIWDTDADIICELTPTDLEDGQPGLGHVRTALHRGLPVVLANKGPFVVAYDEIAERARKAEVEVRFEATVAGAVPTLNAGRLCMAGDTIERVEGILNGTTNFILHRMAEEGSDLDQALREAQALGYAETDPTADLEGRDAAAKVVILANALLDAGITIDDVEVEGIRSVTRGAVELARSHGFRVKLIAEADRDGTARVGPRLVEAESTLDVPGALNAVRFTTKLGGPITHSGAGAGGSATAAAVLSDVVEIAKGT